MNKAFMGLCHTGNFLIPNELQNTNLKDEKLVKKDNQLYIIVNNLEYQLIALDGEAEYIITQFSDYNYEENDSIYELIQNNTNLVVLLYVFKRTLRKKTAKQTMYFYMDRLLKNSLIQNGDIADNDEVKFMQNQFIINNSVFAIEYAGGQATRTFEIYGNEYVASVERENYVFKIKAVRRYKVNNRAEQLVQMFGLVKFISFEESRKISYSDVGETEIKTNQIFKAWEDFLEFEKREFDEQVKELGCVKYDSYKINGDNIVFHFSKKLNETTLFCNAENNSNREYDIVINETGVDFNSIDDIIGYKTNNYNATIRLGKCLNDSYDTDTAKFEVPMSSLDIPSKSIIILSDANISRENNRRKKIMKIINSKTNSVSNIIMRLSAGEEDFQTGSNIDPVNGDVLKKMFGKEDFHISENFRKAMDIAINTPDIALIQGPPGTGKTTLINGIVKRLTGLGNKNYKILISSEQHEAVSNVVDKLSKNSIPPFIASHKYNEQAQHDDEQQMMDNIQEFRNKVLQICDDILQNKTNSHRYSDYLLNIIYDINDIAIHKFDINIMEEKLPDIMKLSSNMGCYKKIEPIINDIYKKMSIKIGQPHDEREGMDLIKKRYDSLLTDENAFFEDDGIRNLNSLQRLIKHYGYNYLLIDDDLFDKLKSNDRTCFDKFLEYLKNIKEDIDPTVNEFVTESLSYQELFDKMMNEIRVYSSTRDKDFYDIIEAFKYRISDVDNVRDIIIKYTNVIGSTCAQAQRTTDIVELNENNVYDYVIIDEAARANPLDLMIPVILGTKVIMVGDQMQLPHYIETDYQRRYTQEQNKYTSFDSTLLTKSLFEVLYEALEKSWKEGKLKYKRHIRIQEQHRMNPIIGNFISQEFYEKDGESGKITNGAATIDNINNYNVFNGKNIVWQNIPIEKGMDESLDNSRCRIVEVEKVVDILQDIIRKNHDKVLNIGIMSFYKKQVELINSRLKEKFDENTLKQVSCNTVDSYQGKEFDIVILSTTRCNAISDIGQSLGFIYYSNSRINVALSRARKLLIVVGDAETMRRSDPFNHYIDYVKKNGFYGG